MKKKQLEELNKQYIGLIQTKEDHIDTLLRIIKQLQREMKLIIVTESNPVDVADQQQILKELVYWIDMLFEEEK